MRVGASLGVSLVAEVQGSADEDGDDSSEDEDNAPLLDAWSQLLYPLHNFSKVLELRGPYMNTWILGREFILKIVRQNMFQTMLKRPGAECLVAFY